MEKAGVVCSKYLGRPWEISSLHHSLLHYEKIGSLANHIPKPNTTTLPFYLLHRQIIDPSNPQWMR